jgi:hypothetical protein
MAPLLITAIGVIIFYIFYVLDEADVEINTDNFDTGEKYLEKNPLTYVNWGAVALLAGVIILGNFAKGYTTEIKEFVEMNAASFGYVSVAAFLGSFALGSSSRFAAITAICVSIYGVQYLPWFFAIDYAGYMLSPAHKCLSISKMYFGTPIKDYYLAILVLCGAVLISAIVTTLIV